MFEARLAKNIGKFIGDRMPIVVIRRAPVLQLVDRLIALPLRLRRIAGR
jgi:hypothetical protein